MSVDFRVELMRQSYFFIALKCGMSRKQWKCIPCFIFWTALLSFGEGIAQGVTFYSDTISNSQKRSTNSTRNSHVPFTYIHLLFTFCSPALQFILSTLPTLSSFPPFFPVFLPLPPYTFFFLTILRIYWAHYTLLPLHMLVIPEEQGLCLTCCCCCLVLQSYPNSVTSWTVACQASLSMEFSRQEY